MLLNFLLKQVNFNVIKILTKNDNIIKISSIFDIYGKFRKYVERIS